MHVLSTPPAFILSQDQTLHKKMFQKETGREKPKPNQKQTNQHKKALDWQNPKITKVQTNPQPDGQKGGWPKIRETCSTTPHAHHEPKTMTRLVIGIQPRHHRHTPKRRLPHSAQNEAGKHTHATKVHWHTIEFSNNTSTPNTNPHTGGPASSDFGIRQRLFSCPPHKPENLQSVSPAGRCRSR